MNIPNPNELKELWLRLDTECANKEDALVEFWKIAQASKSVEIKTVWPTDVDIMETLNYAISEFSSSIPEAESMTGFEYCKAMELRKARAVLARYGNMLPEKYIDLDIKGASRALLEDFYVTCLHEGGSSDEVTLRGLRTVLSRWCGRTQPIPLTERKPQQGDCDPEGRCWYYFSGTLIGDSCWQLLTQEEEEDGGFEPSSHWLPFYEFPRPEVDSDV